MRPVLFMLGSNFQVHSNLFMILVGGLAACILVRHEMKGAGYMPKEIYPTLSVLFVATVIGSRIWYLVQFPGQYRGHAWELLIFWQGGTSIHGGVFFAFFAYWAYTAWRRLAFWKTLDLMAPATFFFLFAARIGCVLAGCCYGRPCKPDLFLCYAPAEPPPRIGAGVPLYPTQAAYAVVCLGIFVLLWFLRKAKTFDGQLVIIGTLVYTTASVLIGFFRGDEVYWLLCGISLTPSQILNIIGNLVASSLWCAKKRRKKPAAQNRKVRADKEINVSLQDNM